MKAIYDGQWVIIPYNKDAALLLLEWLADYGSPLGIMQVVTVLSRNLSEPPIIKLYFEYAHKHLIKDLIDHINK